jgi:hypothetical protein
MNRAIPSDYLQGVPSDRICNSCGGSVWWAGKRMQCASCGGDDYRMRSNLDAPRAPRLTLEANPAWGKFGFRGQVAKLLWNRGLKAKAVRFANCNCLGRPGVCTRYPFEHKFFVPHGCEVILCRECAKAARRALFAAYFEVIRNAVLDFAGERSEFDRLSAVISDKDAEPKFRVEAENALRDLWPRVARRISEAGWVLARINFTLWSDGSEITPDRAKKTNGAVRFTMRRSVGKANGFGMLFMDEVGFETRGHTRVRKARGLNLHAHGLYFGPRLDWEKTRDIWMHARNKKAIRHIESWFLDQKDTRS